MKTHFTPEEVKANPELTMEALSSCGELTYEITPGELLWMAWIRGKYSIEEYLRTRLILIGKKAGVKIDNDFSKALDEDCKGAGKAVMLSDDSALQMIFFYNYRENGE